MSSRSARLKADGATIRLEELAEASGVSLPALLRWIHRGKRGIRLDAVRCGDSWFSSWAALQRFRDATGKGDRTAELMKRVIPRTDDPSPTTP